ncbi:MAG TPA: cellulase-like family protein [Terracidiphilus sp.]|nr:cellulase-like family protein [Terracidiphilus sp.]
MTVSRRDLIALGTAGALSTLATGTTTHAEEIAQSTMPAQVSSDRAPQAATSSIAAYDMRNDLNPRRLTMAMWDQAYALRHIPGGSFADYDRVLDETVERGYNTVRIDPMPQWIDLQRPERLLDWPDPQEPLMPWDWNTAVNGPVGEWIIDFMEKLHKRPSLHYTLSAWWFAPGLPTSPPAPPVLRTPKNMLEGAEMWVVLLNDWKKRFGFDRLVYVDIANETPYFFPGLDDRLKKVQGVGFEDTPAFSPATVAFFTDEINKPLALLRSEFPELRFTTSIHGDLRWLDVPLELDCLDVHFYSDADPRWTERTRFNEFIADGLFRNDKWFAEYSERSMKTARAVAPMLRARERFKAEQFAGWAARRGAPLTTSESWATWYYIDHPKLDWSWLLDWAKWSVDDAIACRFWGWTPHNYVQPQFANWKDVRWHRELTERFLKS